MAVQFTALPQAPLPKVQDRPEITQSSSSSGPRHTQCRSSHGTVMMSWAVIQGRPAPRTLCPSAIEQVGMSTSRPARLESKLLHNHTMQNVHFVHLQGQPVPRQADRLAGWQDSPST